MNSRKLALMLVWLSAAACTAQLASDPRFHWDPKKSQWCKTTLRDSKELAPAQQARLRVAVAEQLRAMDLPEISSEHELQKAVLRVHIKKIQLGPNASAIAAQGPPEACGATGNCPFWIFQAHQGGFDVILDDTAQTFTLQPTKSNGRFDIVLRMHSSAFEGQLMVYRFDGSKYREGGCYIDSSRYLGRDNEFHDINESIIRPCSPDPAFEGQLRIRVTDRTGAVVPNAQIGFRPHPDPDANLIKTGTDGTASFSLQAGDYDLFVTSPQFKPWGRFLHVDAGKTNSFGVTLDVANMTTIVDVSSPGMIDTSASATLQVPPQTEMVAVRFNVERGQLGVSGPNGFQQLEIAGQSDINLNLVPGRYVLMFTSPGYSRWEAQFEIEAGKGRVFLVEATKLPPL